MNVSKLEEHNFELSLIMIAILIPVFLDSFPSIIEKILPFLPIGNIKLNLVTLTSILLGTCWFLILVVGIIQFNSINDKKFFNISFKVGTWFTVLGIFVVIFVYFIYFLNLWIGREEIINTIISISIIGLLFRLYFNHRFPKRIKTQNE